MAVSPRVLSIQSHVVRGYVGNNSATFPLQVLGFEVDAINSVQLCNHTGYAHFMGQVLQAADLETLFRGLKLNDLLTYSHVLTGYVGSKSFLEGVHSIVQELKQRNPKTLFVCDPVLGDHGKFYVPEELVPIYRDQLVPLADVLTPNQFEAELLSGVSIKTKEDALKAIDVLHQKGAGIVMITSSDLSGDENVLLAIGSTKGGETIEVSIPKLPVDFVGTGDLFTALLLAWLFKDQSLRSACQKTVSTMQTVLRRTLEYAKGLAGDAKPNCGQLELRLIQSKDVIESPPSECFEPRVL